MASETVRRYDAIVAAAAARYHVPAALIQAVIHVESGGNPLAFNPERTSTAGASRGLMQIQEATARGLGFTGDLRKLFDPVVNIDLGAKLLAQLMDRFQNVQDVIAAYNGGPRVVLQRIAGRPYVNQGYVDSVLGRAAEYGLKPMVLGPVMLLAFLLVWWWRRKVKT